MKNIILKLFKALPFLIVTFASETWSIERTDENRIQDGNLQKKDVPNIIEYALN